MSISRGRSVEKAVAYHHGSLREALVESGLAILAEGGDPAALSLREAARRAGVSAMAPYRHFPDKEALLAAIAAVGFRRLAARLQAADAEASGSDALVAQGQAYVAFALAEPALFRLMFGSSLAEPGTQRSSEGETAFAVMAKRVASLAPPAARDLFALHCWAVAHGLASLALERQIESEPAALQAIVRGVLGFSRCGLDAFTRLEAQKGIGAPSQAKKPPLSAG